MVTVAGIESNLRRRAARIVERMPHVPAVKALLSRDGGVCPMDGASLIFDPWSADRHRCPRCGREHEGERHHRNWARFQHLWLAERAAELAVLAAVDGDARLADRANQLLAAYASYEAYPNSDNVLGPSRLFFSTYLESIWITNYLAAATRLREAELLGAETADVVEAVANEAATLIGEFDEGFSNRQTWNNAALAAVAVWFEDEELAARAIESPTGLLAHLAHGFADDGTWHEGENYHFFALQGLLTGIRWAGNAGVDALADAELAARVSAALHAPILTALPDLTFPARKDSRFGVSLAQPMYIELWEHGLGMLDGREGANVAGIGAWLRQLYQAPAPVAQLFESYLHEAGESAPERRSRADLSWAALIEMLPALPDDSETVAAGSVLLPSQGLAVLRTGGRYTSLECGGWSGGHGHPDRLHLTIHADGVHWLHDFGTGSYVERDLFWYRSTLAHNAPRLDGASQRGGDAECEAFDLSDGWGWTRGRWGDVTRSVIAGPSYVLDVVQLSTGHPHVLELPWHLGGQTEVLMPGRWEPASIDSEFVSEAARFIPDATGPIAIRTRQGDAMVTLHLSGTGELLRANAPGAPGTTERSGFFLQRAEGASVVLASVLSFGADPVRGIAQNGALFEVTLGSGVHLHSATTDGWDVQLPSGRVRLGGIRRQAAEFEPLVTRVRSAKERAAAQFMEAPALDGSLEGFDDVHTIHLDHDDQYRRSEEPYAGPEELAALAWIGWDDDALYLAVEITKPEICLRPPDAPPLGLDNEVDDIHSDGLQVYLRAPGGEAWGVLVVPEEGGTLRVRGAGGTSGAPDTVRGSWQRMDDGYRVTLAATPAFWDEARAAGELGFDLIVNEMRPGRARRAGQLVWTGGGGWVWLRGDRHDPSRFGVLELA